MLEEELAATKVFYLHSFVSKVIVNSLSLSLSLSRIRNCWYALYAMTERRTQWSHDASTCFVRHASKRIWRSATESVPDARNRLAIKMYRAFTSTLSLEKKPKAKSDEHTHTHTNTLPCLFWSPWIKNNSSYSHLLPTQAKPSLAKLVTLRLLKTFLGSFLFSGYFAISQCHRSQFNGMEAEEQSQKDWLTAVLPTEVQLWIFSFVRSLPDLLRLSCANKCNVIRNWNLFIQYFLSDLFDLITAELPSLIAEIGLHRYSIIHFVILNFIWSEYRIFPINSWIQSCCRENGETCFLQSSSISPAVLESP